MTMWQTGNQIPAFSSIWDKLYGQNSFRKSQTDFRNVSGMYSTHWSKTMLLLIRKHRMLQLHWLMQSATSKRKWLNFSLKMAQIWIHLATCKLLSILLWCLVMRICTFDSSKWCIFECQGSRQDNSNWRRFDEETNDWLQNNDCVYWILKSKD